MKSTFAISLAFSIALVPAGAAANAPSTQRVGGARIAALAARAIRALPVTADRSYLPAFTVPDQIVAAGRVTLAAGAPMISPSYVNVPVTVDVNGKFERIVYAGYRVQRYVQTAVAARDLAAGTVLSAGDVKVARVPYTGQAVSGTAILLGRQIDTTVVKGQPIAVASTVTNMIVKAGSTVVLIVRDSGVALTADVVARTSGGLGDQVQIYNPSTNKSLSGTVIGPGRVELDLSGGNDAQ